MRAGIRIMTPKARKLKEDYIWQVKSQYKEKAIADDVEIYIKLYFGDKRARDWDNYHKLSQDALTKLVLVDDCQIQKATVEKYYDKQNPRIELTINKLNETKPRTA